MFKKDRFSIRKIKGVVGSVFLGSLLMAPSVVDAATYHYVNKEIISQEAKDLIQTGKPDRNEVVYGLVYQKDQLPQTGTEASVLTAFGLLTVGSLLLIYKRKKIASVFLVGAMGLVVLPSAGAVDPVATLALASREGVVEMEGYRYVGYLSGDILKTLGLDTVLEETSAKPGEVTVVEVETPQSTTNQEQARTENQVVETEEAPKEEAPKTEESPKEEPKSEVKPTDDTLPKVEEGKEDSAEPAPVEEVGGEVESKSEEKVAVKPESQLSDKSAEESKVEQVGEPVEPSEDEQAPTAPVEPEKQPEAPEEEKAVEETPKPEDKIKGIGTKEPVDKSELNNQIDKASSVSPTDYSTASYNDLGPVLETAKGVYASEPVKQPEVNSETNKLKTAIDALNVDKSELQEQLRVAEQKQQADYSAKTWREFKIAELQAKEINNPTTPLPKQSEIDAATKALQDALQALAVDKTVLQNAINTANSKREEEYTAQTWKALKDALTAVNPVNEDETATQSKVDEATRNLEEAINNLVLLTEKPVLTFIETDKKALEREVVAKYSLENQNKTKIKSITATLKKGETVVSTVELIGDDVTNETITSAFKNLEYYKEYTLSTTMVYDRGDGDVTEILDNQPIQLDLKKVELKNIKRTDLIKYENGKETNESLITTVPDDKRNYYLKITSKNQKTTLLAVKNIEETTVNGTPVYKVTAIADNLVSRTADNKFEEEYVHYIEKPKVHEDNVYYNFKELVEAIQNDPSKEYRLGQSMSARNVVPNGKSYITKEFTGKLLSSEGKQFAITELEHPLFNVITNATINNVNFENVEIERSGQDNIASLANTMKGSSVITNVKITGTLSGRNNVAGFVNNMNDGTRIENVAFFGKLHSTSGNGSHTGGIAGTNYRGIVRKAYVDATITGNKTRASLLVPKVDYGLTLDHLIGTKALLTESVVKGKIDVSNPVEVGAIASKTWPVGTVSNSVSYAKIIRGEELFGSNDVDDSDYASAHIKDLYAVEGYSSGNRSFRKSKTFTKLTKEQADA
ncbi:TPA: FIVAR domain-containing protein, partial [Streptococcus pneumoniae]|nr:FIVAR domain-containing protein [Streptococcus pneumoniae]